MSLSVPVIIAIGTTGTILIGAFFAGVVTVISAWRTIAAKVSSIEGHVNSEKTASEGRERAKDMEIALLRDHIVDLKVTASLLAQAAATVATAVVARPPDPVP